MKVLKMEVGMLGTNCYIAVNEATGHGVVVDPGGDGDRIVAAIQKKVSLLMRFLSHMVTATISWVWTRCVRLPEPEFISVRKMRRC